MIEESLRGYKIVDVNATEDKIVYTGGTNHDDFVCLFGDMSAKLRIRRKKSWGVL